MGAGASVPQTLTELQRSVDRIGDSIGGDYVSSPLWYKDAKIIRDPVSGFIELDPWMLTIVDSPYFQRLRYVTQNALTYLTYPGAVHSRFEHSLGVLHLSTRMLHAVEHRRRKSLAEPYRTEVQLAALLHDIGHGPFSHSSEDVYGRSPVFANIRQLEGRDKAIYGNAGASEILAWCLLHSPKFRELWEAVDARRPEAPHSPSADSESTGGVDRVSLDRVGWIILGAKPEIFPRELAPYAAIVNGPFDADKLDYLVRDAYFTGLNVPVDTERLLWGLDVVPPPVSDASSPLDLLVVRSSSLSAVEQVLFSRAQMFSQIYQHHKVRAASRLIEGLLTRLNHDGHLEGGLSLSDPASYLALDEADMLHNRWQDDDVRRTVKRIRNRSLAKRSLVISPECFIEIPEPEVSQKYWGGVRKSLLKVEGELGRAEAYLAGLARVRPDQVMIDIQDASRIVSPSSAPIYFSSRRIIPLKDVFPAEGWARAHEAYRTSTYILTDSTERKAVQDAALSWLGGLGVRLNESAQTGAHIV